MFSGNENQRAKGAKPGLRPSQPEGGRDTEERAQQRRDVVRGGQTKTGQIYAPYQTPIPDGGGTSSPGMRSTVRSQVLQRNGGMGKLRESYKRELRVIPTGGSIGGGWGARRTKTTRSGGLPEMGGRGAGIKGSGGGDGYR